MLLLVAILGICIGQSAGLTCIMVDPCSCSLDDGSGIVDLSTLGHSDRSPMFADIPGPDNYLYSLNLCQPFDEGDCSNAAGCQLSQDKSSSYLIGDASSVTFGFDGFKIMILYKADDGSGVIRSTSIALVCDPENVVPEVQAFGETAPGSLTYYFTLTSKCGCPDGCSAAPPPATTPRPGTGPSGGASGGISIGTILCIAVLSLGFVYLVGGMLFMRLQRQARGAEMVPNISLWATLPGLIKDGFLFVFRKIRGKDGYGRV